MSNKKYTKEDLLPPPPPGLGDLRDAYNIVKALYGSEDEIDRTALYILNAIALLGEEERIAFEESQKDIH